MGAAEGKGAGGWKAHWGSGGVCRWEVCVGNNYTVLRSLRPSDCELVRVCSLRLPLGGAAPKVGHRPWPWRTSRSSVSQLPRPSANCRAKGTYLLTGSCLSCDLTGTPCIFEGLWNHRECSQWPPGNSRTVCCCGGHGGSENPVTGPGLGGENRTRGQRVGPAPAGGAPTGQFLALAKYLSFTKVARCSPEVTPCRLQRSGAGNPLVLPSSHTDAPAHNKTPLRLQALQGPGAPAHSPTLTRWVLPPAVYRGSRGTEKSGYQPRATQLARSTVLTASCLPLGSVKQQQKGCGPLTSF